MTAAHGRNLKFGGYYRQPSLQEDEELTHVGPGTPGGEYLRRFWHPVALSAELGDLPLAIRILGEDLVLFRDGGGRVGLLHRHCSHRGTSLEYGIVGERGIRCCYHGWLYDVDGTILETPGEPPESKIRHAHCHGAYPTREHAGLIFAYMGPPDETPDFPIYDSWVWPDGNRLLPYKLHNACNWLQSHENGADPIHTCFLHARGSMIQFSEAFYALPQIDFFETPIGLLSVATRRWNENLWIRASDVILPNAAQFGTGFVDGARQKFALCAWLTRWIVPIDDTSAYAIGLRHFNEVIDPDGQGREDEIGLGKVDFMGQTPAATREEGQRNPGDYEAQVAQRPIAVHANETLGSTDRGVSMTRRMVRQGIRAVAKGNAPERPARYADRLVPTYNSEIVMPVPEAGSRDDQETIRAFGRGVAGLLIESADLPPGERQAWVEARVRDMVARGFA